MGDEGRKEKIAVIITFRKSLKKLGCAVTDAQNASLFGVGSQYIDRIYSRTSICHFSRGWRKQTNAGKD
jgi:hypothetical protein